MMRTKQASLFKLSMVEEVSQKMVVYYHEAETMYGRSLLRIIRPFVRNLKGICRKQRCSVFEAVLKQEKVMEGIKGFEEEQQECARAVIYAAGYVLLTLPDSVDQKKYLYGTV